MLASAGTGVVPTSIATTSLVDGSFETVVVSIVGIVGPSHGVASPGTACANFASFFLHFSSYLQPLSISSDANEDELPRLSNPTGTPVEASAPPLTAPTAVLCTVASVPAGVTGSVGGTALDSVTRFVEAEGSSLVDPKGIIGFTWGLSFLYRPQNSARAREGVATGICSEP